MKSVYRDVSKDLNLAVRDLRTDILELRQRNAAAAKRLLPELQDQVCVCFDLKCLARKVLALFLQPAGRVITPHAPSPHMFCILSLLQVAVLERNATPALERHYQQTKRQVRDECSFSACDTVTRVP